MIKIQREDFNVHQLAMQLKTPAAGCVISFIGTVRDHTDEVRVQAMEVEAYSEMAVTQLETLREEAIKTFGVLDVSVVHRVGTLKVGENIVFIGVAAGHRDEAFKACRYIIDELKQRVPIWKKEITREGEHWVEAEKHE